jgi:3-methyladenine DNA glycosylase/8-oxoguanine DNA glycosylase
MQSLDRLSKLASTYPTMVVECVQMITDASPEYVELWTSEIVTIIKLAFRSDDPLAHVAAQKLIDSLGVRGHLGFRTLLAEDPSVGNQS